MHKPADEIKQVFICILYSYGKTALNLRWKSWKTTVTNSHFDKPKIAILACRTYFFWMISFLVRLDEKWQREWKRNSAKLTTMASQGSPTPCSGRIMNSFSHTCIFYYPKSCWQISWVSLFSGAINFYKTKVFKIYYSKFSSCSMWIVSEKHSFDNVMRETITNTLRKSLTSESFQCFVISSYVHFIFPYMD